MNTSSEKLLSIAVPCYNSQDYMENCIKSLSVGGDEVEILIVDDGSVDRTPEIADMLQDKYPGIVKAIHQPNKGHGGAVNTGLENATGLYFKVVDSDDKVKASAYKSILDTLRKFRDTAEDETIDLLISNFVYDKEGASHRKVMHYRKSLPQNRIFSWDETKRFKKGEYILMHSVIYRTKLLRECGLTLPEHCFYVDNIYVFNPMPYIKNMYYMDVNFKRRPVRQSGGHDKAPGPAGQSEQDHDRLLLRTCPLGQNREEEPTVQIYVQLP